MGRSGRAAVYEAPNTPFISKESPLRPVRPGEALVRVSMSTICRSDIHSYHAGDRTRSRASWGTRSSA
jgi:D-arabinose 1-dehydrogenase-like Zn-dependent alcohol dehydrogenase